MSEMLDQLDAVPWDGLQHAFGPAGDVPALIRALVVPGATRSKALADLKADLWHRGSTREATPHAVPFLMAIATHPDIARRHELLPLLDALASTSGETRFSGSQTRDATPVERAYAVATHRAVGQGLPSLLADLSHPDPRLRVAVTLLLRLFDEEAAMLVPALVGRAGVERDRHVLASIAVALLPVVGNHGDGAERGAALALLARLLREDHPPLVRFAAALGVVQGEKRSAPSEAILVLQDAVRDDALQREWSMLPLAGTAVSWAARSLAAVGPATVRKLEPELLASLDRVDEDTSFELLSFLLWAALGESGHPDDPTLERKRADLTSGEMATLRGILAANQPWLANAHLMGEMLARWGLPRDGTKFTTWPDHREKLRAWLDQG